MNSEEIPPWAHSSPPPPPTGIWKKRLDASKSEWPTTEQIAHLAASLAQAFPQVKPEALAEKALDLWFAARDLMIHINNDPLGDLERRLTRDIDVSKLCGPQIPEPKEWPAKFDLALRFIVGNRVRLPERHKQFRDYLAACAPNAEEQFATLKAKGFLTRAYRSHFSEFKTWRKNDLRQKHHLRAVKAAKASAAVRTPKKRKRKKGV